MVATSSDRGGPSSGFSYGQMESRRRALWLLVLQYGELANEVNAKADCSSKLGLEVVWRFRITMFSPGIRVLDGAAGVRWLLIKGKAMVWIDVGEGANFALVVWKEVAGLIPMVMWVLSFAGALVVLVEWAEPPSACSATVGLLWLVRCGLVCRVFASFLFFLHCLLLQLVLDFSFGFRSQIKPGSSKSGLLSGIWVENWFWVVSPSSIGPNLLVTFSHEIDYQLVLMALTLMSMSNARKGYPKGTPDQLCCSLVFLTQLTAQFYSSLDWPAHPLSSEDI